MVVRGGVYRINLGDARRGHEQRGRRFGVVLSPTDFPWSVITVVPTSTTAQPTGFRPEITVAGTTTRALVDQLRVVDLAYVSDLVDILRRHELAEVELAVLRYLGLDLRL